MIKTIILDESKVNAFLKQLIKERRWATIDKDNLSESNGFTNSTRLVKKFLEATRIEPQTNKQNSLIPYEVNH